jgi:hypothetical protein
MTTMSMNVVRPAIFSSRPTRPAGQACAASIPVRLLSLPALNRLVAQALGVTGRSALALVPFSFLAWMFVAH